MIILTMLASASIFAQEVATEETEDSDKEEREQFQCDNGESIGGEFKLECFKISWLKPSTRVYFDTGSDDEDEIDLFVDGSLNVTLEVLSIAWHRSFLGSKDYSWGPILSAGLSTPAKSPSVSDNAGNMTTLPTASSAPVFMASFGIELQGVNQNVFAEVGYSQGWTADESFGDTSDGAIYVGIKFNF
ncbi:MAG: hypothetical protein COB20_04325 [SAR86 cluster bacterium]|uniref:Uncharacterized protein n=1 Tax=SAR86 cluster bacterium TaxID=2030880 RepID=A0A2A4XBK9_9GAMM|nr:MAG: hypothetical protein COB20_04325 [SAR86 cluster bacterium]